MPSGVYKRTELSRKNGQISQFKKGSPPWNKGKKFEYVARPKMKGKIAWNKGTKGLVKPNKGTFSTNRFVKPQDHPRWKGGISKEKGYNALVAHRRKVHKKGNGGMHNLGEWKTLKAQYNWTCPCCKNQEPNVKLTKDHIIPLTKGGSDNIENIQPLCGSCNSKKYNKIIEKYDR